jgi:hypothetical protein
MARAKVTKTVAPTVEYEKQPWNVYSMMLLLALLALIIGIVFLCLELSAYNWDYNAKTAPRTAFAAPASNNSLASLPIGARLLG